MTNDNFITPGTVRTASNVATNDNFLFPKLAVLPGTPDPAAVPVATPNDNVLPPLIPNKVGNGPNDNIGMPGIVTHRH